jgi:hypothetical protein
MKTDLNQFRVKYLKLINSNEEENRRLREKLKFLDELEADSQKLSDSSIGTTLKYADAKLTKAIFDAVQTIGRNGGITATNVRKYIEANGYKHPNVKNFPVATVIALNRLVKQGEIESVKIDGKRLYKQKEMAEFK